MTPISPAETATHLLLLAILVAQDPKTILKKLFIIALIIMMIFVVGRTSKANAATPDQDSQWKAIPAPLMDVFIPAAYNKGFNAFVLAALSLTETEWNSHAEGSATEKGMFHMRDAARADVDCKTINPYDKFEDSVCAARYLELLRKRCGGSVIRAISAWKNRGRPCNRTGKGSLARRVMTLAAMMERHAQFTLLAREGL